MEKKTALFIGIGFYDYDKAIITEFEQLGFKVDYFSEVPPNNFKFRFYSRFNKRIVKNIISKHTDYIVENCGNDHDYIFVIKSENLSTDNIKNIRYKNAKAKSILYLWDSMNRVNEIETKISLFDEVFSFDRLDCVLNPVLKFNPLFFRNEYDNTMENKDESIYAVYHLGWYHSDRLQLIKKIVKFLDENTISCKMKLVCGRFSYLIHYLFGGELKGNKRHLIFKSISARENFDSIIESKSTLDIAHPLQSGLTMRTIELLGMQKKIITTNSDVQNYDFYHPNNILIIDRENPVFSLDFFKTDYYPVSEEIRSKYSISNWLKRMIN